MPNINDEVVLSSVLEELARIAGDDQSVELKGELSKIFENREALMINRKDFVKSLMVKKTEADQNSPLASPLVSPIEKYEYHGQNTTSEASEMEEDLKRSFGSIPSSMNCSCANNKVQLAKIINSKDRKIWTMEKVIDNLKKDISSSSINEEVLKSSYSKKIEELKQQLREAKKDYSACCRKADKLDDVEYELKKSQQKNTYLTRQMTALKEEHRTAQDQIVSLYEKVNAVVAENRRLKDENDGDKTLYSMVEELRNEKHELQEKLVNVSASMIPNLLDVSEEDISPDRPLIPFHHAVHSISAREMRKLSLDEELAMLPERLGLYPMRAYPGELSMVDRSTSCSDLIPKVVEDSTQTEFDVMIPRNPIDMGTQTGEGLENNDISSLPETSPTSSQTDFASQSIVLALPQSSISSHAGTQTDEGLGNYDIRSLPETTSTPSQVGFASQSIVLEPPQSSISSHAKIQTEAQQESRPNISAVQDESLASFEDISSTNSNYSKSSVSSGTFHLTNILSLIVYLTVLMFCVLMFYPDLITSSELITHRFCNWIATIVRKSVKMSYTKGIPPH